MRPTLLGHRKFQRLARMLGRKHTAAGVLELLWQSAYESGNEIIGDALDVATIADWEGNPNELVRMLIEAGGTSGEGFIELIPASERSEAGEAGEAGAIYRVHDLWDHAPRYVRNRAKREIERLSSGRATRNELLADAGRKRASASKRNHRGQFEPISHRPASERSEAGNHPASDQPLYGTPAPAPDLEIGAQLPDGRPRSSSSEQVKPVPPPPPPAPQGDHKRSSANGADRHPPRSARRGGGGHKKNGATAPETPTTDDERHGAPRDEGLEAAYAAAREADPALAFWPKLPPAYVAGWWQWLAPEIDGDPEGLDRVADLALKYVADVHSRKLKAMNGRPAPKPFFTSETICRDRLDPRRPPLLSCACCPEVSREDEGRFAPEPLQDGEARLCFACRHFAGENYGQRPVAEIQAEVAGGKAARDEERRQQAEARKLEAEARRRHAEQEHAVRIAELEAQRSQHAEREAQESAQNRAGYLKLVDELAKRKRA